MDNRIDTNSFAGLAAIAIGFVAISYVTQTHLGFFTDAMGGHAYGRVSYVVLTVFATVVAPVSSIPLIAAASSAWGFVESALLSIAGWFIGAVIAFELSRAYGQKLIFGFLGTRSAESFYKIVPKDYGFWSLILLRMSIPVDVLSYALGLFSDVSRKRYYLSTAIGIIPFAFIFAYFGTVDYRWQLGVFMAAGVAIWWRRRA